MDEKGTRMNCGSWYIMKAFFKQSINFDLSGALAWKKQPHCWVFSWIHEFIFTHQWRHQKHKPSRQPTDEPRCDSQSLEFLFSWGFWLVWFWLVKKNKKKNPTPNHSHYSILDMIPSFRYQLSRCPHNCPTQDIFMSHFISQAVP